MFQNLEVEGLEARTVVEMPQVGQLVADGVDQARVLQHLAGLGMVQPDGDPAVGVADAVTALHIRPFRR